MKKLPATELIRLAMIYAEQDRALMAECDKGEEGKKALALAQEFRAYRMKRWGSTSFEAAIAELERLSALSRRAVSEEVGALRCTKPLPDPCDEREPVNKCKCAKCSCKAEWIIEWERAVAIMTDAKAIAEDERQQFVDQFARMTNDGIKRSRATPARPADGWVPYKLGDAAPAPGHYHVTIQADMSADRWSALCNVLPANNILAARFDWPFTSCVVAYQPRPLPPPFPGGAV